jgi:hypothetical protein
LAGIPFVEQFDVNTDELVVVTLETREFFLDVLPVVLRHFDVAAFDDDVHTYLHAVAMVAPERFSRPVTTTGSRWFGAAGR